MGCTAAIVLTCFGASYGTAKSGVGICATSVLRPDILPQSRSCPFHLSLDNRIRHFSFGGSPLTASVWRAVIMPTILSGILGIYGLVVSVLIASNLQMKASLFLSFIQLGAGLSVGLAGLAAGFSIGIVGDAGVRGMAQQPRLFVGMVLILIFAEVLGLYGLIVALLLMTTGNAAEGC